MSISALEVNDHVSLVLSAPVFEAAPAVKSGDAFHDFWLSELHYRGVAGFADFARHSAEPDSSVAVDDRRVIVAAFVRSASDLDSDGAARLLLDADPVLAIEQCDGGGADAIVHALDDAWDARLLAGSDIDAALHALGDERSPAYIRMLGRGAERRRTGSDSLLGYVYQFAAPVDTAAPAGEESTGFAAPATIEILDASLMAVTWAQVDSVATREEAESTALDAALETPADAFGGFEQSVEQPVEQAVEQAVEQFVEHAVASMAEPHPFAQMYHEGLYRQRIAPNAAYDPLLLTYDHYARLIDVFATQRAHGVQRDGGEAPVAQRAAAAQLEGLCGALLDGTRNAARRTR